MLFVPFIIILMLVSGISGFMIFISPESFKADPLSTAMFMSGLAFSLCWLSFFALSKLSEVRQLSKFDKEILDFWQNNPEYIIRKEGEKWIAYHRKKRIYCEGSNLRDCLSFVLNADARWERKEEMYELKVGEAGLKNAVKAEEGCDITAGYVERDLNNE